MENSIVTQNPANIQDSNHESFKGAVDRLLDNRKYFIDQVLPILKDKTDYHVIIGKKSLAKGGAEKLASIYSLVATFEKDKDVMESLSSVPGLIAFRCDLQRDGQIKGQGRGAATLAQNQGNPNKTIKMAQKCAYVDAVIRATGLSDIFTQDLEDMPREQVKEEEVPVIEYDKISDPFTPEEQQTIHYGGQVKKTYGKPVNPCTVCGGYAGVKEQVFSKAKFGKIVCYTCQKKEVGK